MIIDTNNPVINPIPIPDKRLAIDHKKVKSFCIDSRNNLVPKDIDVIAIMIKYFPIYCNNTATT